MSWFEGFVVLVVAFVLIAPKAAMLILIGRGAATLIQVNDDGVILVRRSPGPVESAPGLRRSYTRAANLITQALGGSTSWKAVLEEWPESDDPSLSSANDLVSMYVDTLDVATDDPAYWGQVDAQVRALLGEAAAELAAGRILVDPALHKAWRVDRLIRDHVVGLVFVGIAAVVIVGLLRLLTR